MTAGPDGPKSALTGFNVLDMTTGMAGALATMFLCDNGANVIRTVRHADHVVRPEPGYALWDRGKKAILTDDASAEGAIERLAPRIDVVVEDLAPGADGKAAALLHRLQSAGRRPIHCSITAYGPKGPLALQSAQHDLVMARAGTLSGLPGFRDGPMHLMHPVASVGAGLLAAMGTAAAASPVSKHAGWRPSATTSPATSASRLVTSSTPPSTSRADRAVPTTSSAKTCPTCSKSLTSSSWPSPLSS